MLFLSQLSHEAAFMPPLCSITVRLLICHWFVCLFLQASNLMVNCIFVYVYVLCCQYVSIISIFALFQWASCVTENSGNICKEVCNFTQKWTVSNLFYTYMFNWNKQPKPRTKMDDYLTSKHV